ncbi:MAG: serine/threonine protein kinase [Lachnospiraceae bacterium]|nr:serine/threonine protein kinase [Lachnospiraceae bacterium]
MSDDKVLGTAMILTQDDIEITVPISKSSKAEVYLASIKDSDKLVVYKKLQGEQLAPLYNRIKEINSPYFPQFYSVWAENGATMLIEEYIAGELLSEKLEKEHRFSEDELTEYMMELGFAVSTLHKLNPPVIHRDLKPENIIITKNGKLKLLDFDASRQYREDVNHDTIVMGTREYASPEQFGFSQTDVRSDIYSFGIVFAELLEKSDVTDAYRKKCRKIIDKATMFNPDNRYRDVDELLDELRNSKKIKNGTKRILPKWMIALVGVLVIAGICLLGRSMLSDTANQTGASSIETGGLQDGVFDGEEKNTTPIVMDEIITTPAVGGKDEMTSTTAEIKEPTQGDTTTVSRESDAIPVENTQESGQAEVPSKEDYPEGMRFVLRYEDGTEEAYAFFGEVSERINSLNNPNAEYIVYYINNEGYEDNGLYHIYADKMPSNVKKLTFRLGAVSNEEINDYWICFFEAKATYPVVFETRVQLLKSEFEDVTVGGVDSIISMHVNSGNKIKKVTLASKGNLVTTSNEGISLEKCIMEDQTSLITISEGPAYIKELECREDIHININGNKEADGKVLLITDCDISEDQLSVSYMKAEEYEVCLAKNDAGQSVVTIVNRK